MLRRFVVLVLFVCYCQKIIFAGDFDDFQKQQNEDIVSLQEELNNGLRSEQNSIDQSIVLSESQFLQWQQQERKEFEAFRNNIEKQWGSFNEPSNTKWVEYSKDSKTSASVDFEKGFVTVEVLKSSGENIDQTNKRLEQAVIRIAESKGSTEAAPVETKEDSRTITNKPILQGQLALSNGKEVNGKNAADLVKEYKSQEKVVSINNSNGAEKIVLTFPLAPNNLKKRMEPYIPYVNKYCSQLGIDPAHVLATIHTESYFNPAARSNCGALGLMQLMPDRGAAEAYKKLKGKNLIPSKMYLFDGEKNIELGCIYISILKNTYFQSVKNKNSLLFCAISAYNTGPGNVSFAFSGKRKLDSALGIINSLDESQVFSTLIKRLPYPETRDYLKKVSERMKLYQ